MGLFRVFRLAIRVRRRTAMVVIFGAIAALLPIVNPSSAIAGGVALTGTWVRDAATGRVTYNMTLRVTGANTPTGPCAGACFWRVDTWHSNGTTPTLVAQGLHSGSGDPGSADFSRPLSGTGVAMRDATHLRVWVVPKYNSNAPMDSGLVEVAAPTTPSASITKTRWDRDEATGRLTYDLTLNVSGAGAYKAPCDGSCSWRIETWYSDGTSSVYVPEPLGSGSATTSGWSFSKPVSATGVWMKDVTHVRGWVTANYSGNPPLDTGLVPVDDASTGGAKLIRSKWERDPLTGHVSYDLTLDVWDAGSWNGPCEGTCYWQIETWHQEEGAAPVRVDVLGSGTVTAPSNWDFKKTITATGRATPPATFLRGVVVASYSTTKREFNTGLVFVGDATVEDQDMVPLAVALAPALAANRMEFCTPLADKGTFFNGGTLSDWWHACENAVRLYAPNARKILVVLGSAAAAGLLYQAHVDEPKIPSDEEEASPPAPFVWTDEQPDNGCNDGEIWYTSLKAGHLDARHSFGSNSGASTWKQNVSWRRLLAVHARGVMPYPEPGIEEFNCVRIVTHPNEIGFDYPQQEMTHVYTVITKKETAELVTVHPGYPTPRDRS